MKRTTKIWLHRISRHAEVAYPLLDNGYLSIGYSDLVNLILSKTVAEKTVGNHLKNTLTRSGEKDQRQGITFGGSLQKWGKAT